MNSRRTFLAASAASLMAPPLSYAASPSASKGSTPFAEPTLAFQPSALEPHISARTVELHFGTHHMGYYKRLLGMVKSNGWEGMSLEELITLSHGKAEYTGVYNNAGQIYNHNAYWASLSPVPTVPSAPLKAAIDLAFGSIEKLQEALIAESNRHFGSGWAWLVSTPEGRLQVISTHDADTPITLGLKGILVVDVWEHAYYLDRQAGRAAYSTAVVNNLLNWTTASANYASI